MKREDATTVKLTQQLIRHINELTAKHGKFTLVVDFMGLFSLLQNLELALAHHDNKGPSADVVRGLVDGILAPLEDSSPGIAELMRKLNAMRIIASVKPQAGKDGAQ